MLKNQKKKIEITANSVVEITDGDSKKLVEVEGYSCRIDSANPGNIEISKWPMNADMKKVYKEHRSECRSDWAEFEDAAYTLQDEMLAALEAEAE